MYAMLTFDVPTEFEKYRAEFEAFLSTLLFHRHSVVDNVWTCIVMNSDPYQNKQSSDDINDMLRKAAEDWGIKILVQWGYEEPKLFI